MNTGIPMADADLSIQAFTRLQQTIQWLQIKRAMATYNSTLLY